MESRAERSVDEADSRGANVETGKRTRRSSDVRETCDLGIKWPQWHTLMFSDEIKIDMRFVCPKDVKKMLVQKARSVNWKKVGSKARGMKSLKEGVWLEPGL